LEGRHWNNTETPEDVATGTAAGCVAAYLCWHGRIPAGKEDTLHQGWFMGRPSRIAIPDTGTAQAPAYLSAVRVPPWPQLSVGVS
jgi:predicted PhzF superfamily epimerase YddE/YHI9